MNKRCQSNIIVIVLLIFVVLVAFTIIYTIIKKEINQASYNLEAKVYAATNINLKITGWQIDGNNLKILVQNTGQQDISSFAVRIINSTEQVYSNNSVYLPNREKLGPLNTKGFLILPAPFGTNLSHYILFEVYPKFEYEGKEEIAEVGKSSLGSARGGGGSSSGPGIPVPPIPDCTDGIQNQDELGVDCGGSCSPCIQEKNLMVYNNPIILPDKTINASATLDYVEAVNGNSYSYLICLNNYVKFHQEYNETTDSWPLLEGLLVEAQEREIDIWVTFHNPIPYQAGSFGELGKKMMFKEWFASLANLSKEYPNLKGVIVDDFAEEYVWASSAKWKDANGEHLYTAEYLEEMQEMLDAQNPNFKFYIIFYYPNLFGGVLSRIPYIDGAVFPDYGYGGSSSNPTALPSWANTDTMNSQVAYVNQIFISHGKDFLLCAYVTKHSWWKIGSNSEEYIEKVLRKGLEETDGIYDFTLVKDDPNFLNEGFCDNLPVSATQATKNACVVKKVFCEYNPNCSP